MKKVVIFWHRRDLRIHDNAGLYHALRSNYEVIPVFIFDTTILDALENKHDARVHFIHESVTDLKKQYQKAGGNLLILHGRPLEVISELVKSYNIAEVYTNRDYEPYAQQRDKEIHSFLATHKIPFKGFKDHVVFEKNEVVKPDGLPYTIFTPFSRKWKEKLNTFYTKSYPVEKYLSGLSEFKSKEISLLQMGFFPTETAFPSVKPNTSIIANYHLHRDLPSVNGTSRLSLHLRFGTISVRTLVREYAMVNEKYLNEIIWRDFYQMILFHFPHTVKGAFKPAYDKIKWRNNEGEFKRWCDGQTGYPIVDAGMRELNETGFMHNRVRMIVASFLTKHLLIDWRWGEAYFAEKLLDFELASNVGGWQWAAGCGCDAAPYFRVFNPELQTQKFDPEYKYIRKWVKEWGTAAYPKPMVDHKMARERVLTVFKAALNAN